MKKIHLCLWLVMLLPSIAFSSYDCSDADNCTVTCDGTNDHLDLINAHTGVNSGGTIAIGAGACSMSGQVEITKSVTIIGAGSTSTQINQTYSGELIYINPGSDKAIRVTEIHFSQTTNNTGYTAVYIRGSITGAYNLTQVRIDNNKFTKGSRTIHARGRVEGVIDHNTFVNNNIAVGISGDDGFAWSIGFSGGIFEAGTSHALFIEDNLFTITNDTDREPNHLIYHQEAGRSVLRYNTFDGTAYTDGNSIFYDSHGNQNYYDEGTGFRGQPINEVYHNSFSGYATYQMGDIRGGSTLWWGNSFAMANSTSPMKLIEEEAWSTAHFPSGLDTIWPAEDQITNTFFWDNTGDFVIYINGTNEDIFIQEDRDYFLHAPQSTGGKAVYTDRAGAAGNDTDGTLSFSSSGSNAYYPYTPYTYPHPLRTQYHKNGAQPLLN